MNKKKDHADFQNKYSQSSNFGRKSKEEKLKIKGDGELKLDKDREMRKEEAKEAISEILEDLSEEE